MVWYVSTGLLRVCLCNAACALCSGKLNALLPEFDFGPNLNFIGLKTEDWISSPFGWVLEKPPTPFGPADLYMAQKLTRATRLVQPPGVLKPAGVCAPTSTVTTVAAASSVAPPDSPGTATSNTTATAQPTRKRFFFFF